MGLSLYYFPHSSSSRVHWALEELELPYEAVRINLPTGEQKQPEYLKLNPNGKVPTLVVDGQPLFESLAMLSYLGETYGVEKGLYPKPGLERALAQQWMFWGVATLSDPLMRVARNTLDRFPADERNAKAAETAKADAQRVLGILEAALTGKDYILGAQFSLVDIALVTFVFFMARVGLSLEAFPQVQAWMARCYARPAYKRVPTQ